MRGRLFGAEVGLPLFIGFGGPDHDDGTKHDAAESGDLRVRQTPIQTRIDAHELDEKTSDAGEDQVEACHPADGLTLAAEPPEYPKDGERKEELVEGCGLHEGVRWRGRNQGILRHVDAPRQCGVDAVIAVTGGKAANAADAIAEGCGRGCKVQHANTAEVRAGDAVGWTPEVSDNPLPVQREDACNETAVPGESSRKPMEKPEQNSDRLTETREQDLVPGHGEFAGIFKLMPELGSDDASKDNNRDDVQGI